MARTPIRRLRFELKSSKGRNTECPHGHSPQRSHESGSVLFDAFVLPGKVGRGANSYRNLTQLPYWIVLGRIHRCRWLHTRTMPSPGTRPAPLWTGQATLLRSESPDRMRSRNPSPNGRGGRAAAGEGYRKEQFLLVVPRTRPP